MATATMATMLLHKMLSLLATKSWVLKTSLTIHFQPRSTDAWATTNGMTKSLAINFRVG